jgi:hypothetical protein
MVRQRDDCRDLAGCHDPRLIEYLDTKAAERLRALCATLNALQKESKA